MSWLGDVLKFEKFNAKEMWHKIKDDPERLFIGAADPFSSKVWGKVLGKDYEPIVDQWGGASKDTYKQAEEAGINTGPGKTMHNIAKTVASVYAGGAAAKGLGSVGSGGTEAVATGGDAAAGSGTTGGGAATADSRLEEAMRKLENERGGYEAA